MMTMSIETPQLFAELYTAFQAGERALTGVRNLQAAGRVYDALDLISIEVKDSTGAILGRQLAKVPTEIQLETADWELFVSTVKGVIEKGAQGAGRILDARRSLAVLAALANTA